jgi:hypothetical protein
MLQWTQEEAALELGMAELRREFLEYLGQRNNIPPEKWWPLVDRFGLEEALNRWNSSGAECNLSFELDQVKEKTFFFNFKSFLSTACSGFAIFILLLDLWS